MQHEIIHDYLINTIIYELNTHTREIFISKLISYPLGMTSPLEKVLDT